MSQLREKMITEMKLAGLSPNTQKQYVDYVRRFSEFFPDKTLLDLEMQHIREYVIHCQKKNFLKVTSLSYYAH